MTARKENKKGIEGNLPFGFENRSGYNVFNPERAVRTPTHEI